MTQQTPTFSPQSYELRNYTNPYLTPEQSAKVAETEGRVQSQLNFLAQSLGWSGPNYWSNLAATADQKRQLLGGTFGVYNSYLIPNVYEIRNWDNTIVIDPLPFLAPGVTNKVSRIFVGDTEYKLESVKTEGDKYVVSIGTLSEDFYRQISDGTPIRVDVPTHRPAPFYRPEVGVSGDYTFTCGVTGTSLVLYPKYDTKKKFPFKSPTLFASSVYYFDQPIYLATDSSLTPVISPSYDDDSGVWYLTVPSSLSGTVGLTAYLVWANTGATVSGNYSLPVVITSWGDPSDWKDPSVLDNFRGVWGNKGGVLPFNFAFDALSIHGFNESPSVYMSEVQTSLAFNDIVNYVYYQKSSTSDTAPNNPSPGDLWWSEDTGALSVWLPNEGCGAWVEITYRQQPTQTPVAQVVYADMTAFSADSGSLPVGTSVRIDNITGLSISDNVIGVQGILQSPAWLILHRESSEPYWTADEFGYANISDFRADALSLPYKVPVTLYNAAGLEPTDPVYTVTNLPITVTGDYDLILRKFYTNTNWEVYPDNILKYIAFSALFGGPSEGEMWWDFVNTDPSSRAASVYHGSAWVNVNIFPQSGPPAPSLNLGTILFYSNGSLLADGQVFRTSDYEIVYTSDAVTGEYTFNYNPLTFVGKVQLPVITISDSLTTVYRADITNLVFSGLTYYVSPSVQNAETPLRLWKGQDLQVVENTGHLAEKNYSNPLRADINNGPGPENWEKYFIRLPLEYGRNEAIWQRVALICQDFAYWGSSIEPETMRCPPEDNVPAIYEELFLYDESVPDYTYVYCEPYLYSNIAYFNSAEDGPFMNSGIFPSNDERFDEFSEALLVDYEPLHNRQADVTSPVSTGYGEWLGDYVNINPCTPLTGFYTTDLLSGGLTPVQPPVWDASIYKFAPTCENSSASYNVDANHYKIGYCYFVADASAAEDAFFDITQEAAWRYPVSQPKTLYLTPQ